MVFYYDELLYYLFSMANFRIDYIWKIGLNFQLNKQTIKHYKYASDQQKKNIRKFNKLKSDIIK